MLDIAIDRDFHKRMLGVVSVPNTLAIPLNQTSLEATMVATSAQYHLSLGSTSSLLVG
jgi:hypothetical protein